MKQVGLSLGAACKASSIDGRACPPRLFIRAAMASSADVALIADLVIESLAPGGAAGEHQRRVELVRTLVDPLPQPLAAGLLKGGLLQRAVFDDHHVPAEIPEQLLVALPQSFAH